METTMTNAIQLLKAVRSTMDSIDVRGVENQDKFVGCANAVLTVVQTLEKIQQEIKAAEEPTILEENGIVNLEEVNGR